MSLSANEYVQTYATNMGESEIDLERSVTERSGLDAAGMMQALTDPWFTEPGRQPLALQMMCDWMKPDGSIYYDAIYGAFDGQSAIRNWLLPTMATIDFIEFSPTAPDAFFDDGLGGSSLDEWQMIAVIGDDRIPLSRGVSVRRFRDGWITWACDVYDTGPFRVPPPPDMEVDVETEPIPDWPRTSWTTDQDETETAAESLDVDAIADGFHETDSVYHDSTAGELHGRDAIRTWLTNRKASLGTAVFEPLGPRLNDGTTTVQEWQQMAVHPDGSRTFMTRGTSVRRSEGDHVVYAADYYDTASLTDPD